MMKIEPLYWYQLFSLISFSVCLIICLYHTFRLLRLGKPVDFSTPAGSVKNSILYSFTGAMNPAKKESAFLHLPTYFTGIIYHLGTLLSIIVFFLLLSGIHFNGLISNIIFLFCMISSGFGSGLFIKRITRKGLRDLSNPDDYISNLLVTLFQFITAATLYFPALLPVYFIFSGLFWLYFPAGKLKHAIYFFAARVHLGYFYGWRGVWPPTDNERNADA